MRRFGIFLSLFLCQCVLLAALIFVGQRQWQGRQPAVRELGQVVETLGLTDLALWSEARYTRHPSQADFFSAFQNAPASLDSFPAGSFVPPPPHLSHRR